MFNNGILARVLYDFRAAGEGEVSLAVGEEITIVKESVGDGWCDVRKANGSTGLAPKSYIETIEYPEPRVPPPPLPPPAQPNSFQNQWVDANNRWDTATTYPPPKPRPDTIPTNRTSHNYGQQQQQGYPSQVQSNSPPKPITLTPNDDWEDEDWEDDDSVSTEHTQSQADTQSQYSVSGVSKDSKYATVSRKINKANLKGGDAYLFGTVPDTTHELNNKIVQSTEGPMWDEPKLQYGCVISSPTKESKMKGLKHYIAYKLRPTANTSEFSGIQVSRRFKQFDWLHQRLVEKFPTCLVPPLPDKQISGRYEDDFILERMRQLQLWVNRLCLHPVISQCTVWHHFLKCTDLKAWKTGKRSAEKDEFQNVNFFHTVEVPPQSLTFEQVDPTLNKFTMFVKTMDDSLRHLINVGESSMKRYQNSFRKDFVKIGESFVALSKSFDHDLRPASRDLSNAIDRTGRVYEDIGSLFGDQPRNDMVPLLEGLLEYKGMLSVFPDILRVEENVRQKLETVKANEPQLEEARTRADVITYATLAELNHFHRYRVADFRLLMHTFIKEQIKFYEEIVCKLRDQLPNYES